jgi:hypothetical protein
MATDASALPIASKGSHRSLAKAHKMRMEGRSIRAIAVALKIARSTIAGALAASGKPALPGPLQNGRDSGHQQGEAK